MTQSTRLGDLSLGIGLDFSDADAQLAKYKQHVERETGVKLDVDNRAALSATDRVKRDIEALGEVTKKQTAGQVQATRVLGAQYDAARKAILEQNAAVVSASRQDQAAAQARTAQLREQQAQLSLTMRLAAKQRQDEKDATRQTLGGIETQVKAYRDLWQARVLSNDQVYAQQARLRDQALSLLLTVDKQSAAYRQLTQVAAAAQRTMDASQNINTPGGVGAGVSQGITNALGQFGVTGDLIAGFIQMFTAKRAAASQAASTLGRDTMAGLVTGMKNNQAQVKEVADSAGDSVAEAIRVSLDIHSPSRVTEYLGKMAGLGFVTGMKSYQDEAAAAARALSTAAEGGLRNTAASGGAFGGTAGNFDAGNLAASATALAALNQQLLAAQSAGEGAAEGADDAAGAADGLGESVGGAAEQVKTLRDAHNDQDAASRRAALNEAQTAIAFTATAAAVTAVAVALVALYNTAADYQRGMNAAKATTEATAEELARLDTVARSPQFVQLGVGAKAAAAGIEELGSQGLSTADIMDGGLLVSLTLAKAVNTDVAKAAAVAASSTKAFGLEAKDLARIGDITTNAVNGTSIKMDSFSDAIAAGGDQAKRSGLNFTEFTAGISFLTDKAIGASDAGTSLKSFLMALTPNTKDAANEMKRLGFSAFDSQGNFKSLADIAENLRRSFAKLTPEQAAVSAEMIFGSDGARVYGALVEQGNKGVQERIALLDRQGTMEEAARQKLEGARGAQEKLNAAIENFKITAGSMLLGPAAKLIDWATTFLTKIDAVNQELAKVTGPGEIKATLKIDWSKDDATTIAYKLLVGGVEGTKNVAQGALDQFAQTGLMQNIRKLDALQLQTQLQQAGVIATPRNGDVGAATRQYDDILANMGKYQQLLAEALARNTAATEKATAAGTRSLQAGIGRDLITGRQLTAVVPSQVDGGVLSGSGPLLPGQARPGDPKKATGLWTQEFISSLKDTFVSDPKVDSDCAIIATRILQAIGVKIAGSPIAADLAKEIKGRGGTQKVSQTEAQAGDYIDFAGPGYGYTSGHHSGVVVGRDSRGRLQYINNHGYGSRPGVDVPTTIDTFDPKYVAKRGTATFYRVAESPYAQGGRGVSDAPATASRSFEDYRKEASRILAQIAKFAPDGTAPDGAKWSAASAQLEKFGKQNEVAAEAVKYAQLQMGMASKEVSKFGQAYDRLKGQLNVTDSLDKLGENVVPQLKAIQVEAQKAAAAELTRNGRTEKYRELLGLAGEAASKLKTIENRKPELSALEREQQTLRETQAQDALEKSIRRASATRLRAIVEGGVQREGDLDRVQAAQKELDRREELGTKRQKEARTEAARVNEAIRQGDIASAQAALTRLEGMRDAGLAKVKGNAVAELGIQKQYADLIYNARKAVLNKEKKDRDDDIKNSSLPQAVKKKQLENSGTTYENDLAAAALVRTRALSEATRTVQVETQKQAAAVTDLTQKYAAASALLKTKAQAGTLTAEDMTAYTRQLAGYWDEAGKAGVKSVPALKAAHDAAKAFGLTALDLNGAAVQMAQGGVALDEYPDQAGRFTAAQNKVQASLDDVLGLLPESQEEWAAFIKVMEELDGKGNLAVGVLDKLREKMDDILAVQQAQAGEEAGDRALGEILVNPVGDRGYRPDAPGDTQKALYNDLLTTFSALGAEAAKDTTLMGLYADMLDNAGKSGGLTAEQLEHLKNVLGEGRASFDALTEGIEASTDALRDLQGTPIGEGTFRPDAVGAAQRETFDNLKAALEGIDGATLESADSLNLYEGMVENAGEQGAVTAEQLKKLRDILLEIKGAANVEINLGDIYAHPDQYSDGPGRPVTLPSTFEAAPGFEVPQVDAQDVGYLTQMADVFERFRTGGLADPEQLEAFTASLRALKEEGKLTGTELEALLDTVNDLTSGDSLGDSKPLSLSEWQNQLTILTDEFDSGVSTAEQYAEGLNQLGRDLEGVAQAADKAGNPTLAKAFRDQAAALRAVNPEVVKLLGKLGKVQEYAGYVRDAAGAFGQLAGAIGESEQEYDSVTGAKLQTPWKDLAANLDGASKAAGKLVELVGDVMAVVSNPADIGAWVRLITNVVSSIADAIAGFAKARAEVQRLKSDFQEANPLLNGADYQNSYTRSRGFFADVFGGGPEVVNEIDKVGLPIAQSIAGSITSGITSGFDAYAQSGNLEDFSKAMNAELTKGIKSALVQGFLDDPQRKNDYAAVIKQFTDAWKTHDPAQIMAAAQGIYAQTQATAAAARDLAEQMDALDRLNGTGRYSPEALAQQARDLTVQQRGIEEQELELQHTRGLVSTAEYERQRLALALRRIEQERAQALAAAGLTAEQIALINAGFDLQAEQAQADADAARRSRAEQLAKDLRGLTMNNAETALGIEEKLATSLATTEEEKYQVQRTYAERRLALTLTRLDAEEAADKAAVDLSLEGADALLAAIGEKYRLAREGAQADLTVMENQYAAQQRAALESELNTLKGQWVGVGTSAFMAGLEKADFSSFLDTFRGNLTQSVVQGIVDAEVGRLMTEDLKPLIENYRLAIKTEGITDDLAAVAAIREGVTSGAEKYRPIFDALTPLMTDVKNALVDNTAATQENTEAKKAERFSQTTLDLSTLLASRSGALRAILTR